MKVIFLQKNLKLYRYDFYKRLSDLLSSNGDELELFYDNIDKKYSDLQISKLKIKHYTIRNFVFLSSSFIKACTKGDIVVFPGDLHYVSNFYQIIFLKIKGVKVVWWSHVFGKKINSKSNVFKSTYILLALFCDALITYVKRDKERLQYILGKKYKNIYYCQNGCEINISFKNKLNDREFFLNRLKNPYFVFCGRLTDKVNLKFLFKSCQILNKSRLYNFIVIGDGAKREEYTIQVKKMNLDNISFLGEIYDNEKLQVIFENAVAFIYPGDIGLSLNHAYSYGLPVITHDDQAKHMPEFSYFKDGVNGFSYVNGDVKSFLSSIEKIFSSVEGYYNICLQNYNDSCNVCNTKIMSENFMKVFTELKNK